MSVLRKASELIECLGQAGEPVTLGYVQAALGMPKSSVHRLLNDLAALRIVRRSEDGRYSLGPRLLYWGEAAAETFDLRTVAERPMRRLRDEVAESVHLYIREEDTRICIAAVEARNVLRPFIELGRPLPLRVGAAGKLLLAFADPEIQDLEVSRARSEASSMPRAPGATLREQLDHIRTQRFATSIGEREEGISAAAAGVVDAKDRVVGALSVSAPTSRVDEGRLEELRGPLEACAAEIHALLSIG